MPETIRATLFILFAVSVAYLFFKKSILTVAPDLPCNRLLILYGSALLLAAILPGFWIFLITLFLIIWFFSPRDVDSRLLLFLCLMLALPNLWLDIPGFGGMRFLMTMSYPRFLIIVLLLTLLFQPAAKHRRFGALRSDYYLTAYLLLRIILGFREDTITNGLREGVILFIDVIPIYYVMSRYIQDTQQLQKLLVLFVFILLCLSLIGMMETVKNWHLYNPFIHHLGTRNPPALYLERSGLLRASTIFYTPIALGFAVTLAYGAYLQFRPSLTNPVGRLGIPLLLLGGLAASLSRGPWVGFALLIFVYTLLQRNAISRVIKGFFLTLLFLPIASLTPFWDKFINLLPFIGSVEHENITYRQRLIDNAWLVFQKYPLFGSPNYRNEPEMLKMIQGQGIIDVVNSYIRIGLENGAVGLFFFVAFFIWLLRNSYRLSQHVANHDPQLQHLGICFTAMTVSTMFIISTVSSIDYIPYLYWMLSGLVGAYIFITREKLEGPESQKT